MERSINEIKKRGVEKIGLIISDNLTGLDKVIPLVYRNVTLQKCVVYLKRNILNEIVSKHKEEVANTSFLLISIMNQTHFFGLPFKDNRVPYNICSFFVFRLLVYIKKNPHSMNEDLKERR